MGGAFSPALRFMAIMEWEDFKEQADLDSLNYVDYYNWNDWNRNEAENRERGFLDCPVISELFGEWEGKRVWILAAGPSLLNKIDYLRDSGCLENDKVICVDRAVQVTYRHKIKPDIVITADKSKKCATYMGLASFYNTIFAGCVISDPLTWRHAYNKGDKIYKYSLINELGLFWNGYEEKYGKEDCVLQGGCIVTFIACDLAVKMGAKEVVTIGNDLCIDQFGVYQEAMYNNSFVRLKDGTITVPGFLAGRNDMSMLPTHHKDVKFIDVSGGLDKGENWTQTNIEEVV